MTFTRPATVLGTCFFVPNFALTHLGFQHHPQFLHSAIFAKSELGFRESIRLNFVIVRCDFCFRAEETDVD